MGNVPELVEGVEAVTERAAVPFHSLKTEMWGESI